MKILVVIDWPYGDYKTHREPATEKLEFVLVLP